MNDLLCLKAVEFFLLFVDGRLQVEIGTVVTILVKLQGRVIQLKKTQTVTHTYQAWLQEVHKSGALVVNCHSMKAVQRHTKQAQTGRTG